MSHRSVAAVTAGATPLSYRRCPNRQRDLAACRDFLVGTLSEAAVRLLPERAVLVPSKTTETANLQGKP